MPASVYLDAARHFLDVQIDTMKQLDTRTTQFLSVASLALPVTFALLRPTGASGDGATMPVLTQICLVVALLAFLGVLGTAARASAFRALEFRPDISTLGQHSERYSGIELQRWVAREYHASILVNTEVLQRKARWVGLEALTFFVEGLFLSLAAVLALLL